MEQHRVLIVILSLCLFVAVVLGAGLWLFYPRADRDDPAFAATTEREAGREFDPIEYLRRGEEEAPLEPAEDEPEDDIIIVYGEPVEPDQGGIPFEAVTEGVPDGTPPPPGDVGRPATTEGVPTEPRRVEPTVTAPGRATQPAVVPAPPARSETQPRAAAARSVRPAEPRVETRQEYWIQLISSPSLDTVEQARRRLNEWTISGVITSITKDDTTFYRLRVGPYPAKAEAQKFLDWIQRIEGFGNSYVSLVHAQRVVAN